MVLFFLILFSLCGGIRISSDGISNINSLQYINDFYTKIYHEIRHSTSAYVFRKGSQPYKKQKITQNGWCSHISPDLIIVPKSTYDVSTIVKIARYYEIPLSVRSGGHSYICSNIKNEGIQIDTRRLNKVELTSRYPFYPSGPALKLGPGQTWGRVLSIIPPNKYTMIHGACMSVGVGGFLVGGGAQASGTSQRLGFGNFNVLQFTMVDANGNIMRVSEGNITKINPYSGSQVQLHDEYNLFRSLQIAGSSFGVITEFHYRIFKEPELLPTFAVVYIDDEQDLINFQRAALDGRYSVAIYFAYFFKSPDLMSAEKIGLNAYRILLKLMPILRMQRKRPIGVIILVDNYPLKNQIRTDKKRAYSFLKYYHMKLVFEGIISDAIQMPAEEMIYGLENYDSFYRTKREQKRFGPRPSISANFFNLTNISTLSDIFFRHPLFGFRNMDSRLSSKFGCEFCWMDIIAINTNLIGKLSTPIFTSTSFTSSNDVISVDLGNFQVEVTCHYKPGINSRCPKTIARAKTMMRNLAIRKGEKFTQYWNTPSCDESKDFKTRYFNPENYKMLLKAKEVWDPENIFNHCQSIGSTTENCCPPYL